MDLLIKFTANLNHWKTSRLELQRITTISVQSQVKLQHWRIEETERMYKYVCEREHMGFGYLDFDMIETAYGWTNLESDKNTLHVKYDNTTTR